MPLVGAEDLKHKDLFTRDSDLILISYDLIYGLYIFHYIPYSPYKPYDSYDPYSPYIVPKMSMAWRPWRGSDSGALWLGSRLNPKDGIHVIAQWELKAL